MIAQHNKGNPQNETQIAKSDKADSSEARSTCLWGKKHQVLKQIGRQIFFI